MTKVVYDAISNKQQIFFCEQYLEITPLSITRWHCLDNIVYLTLQ